MIKNLVHQPLMNRSSPLKIFLRYMDQERSIYLQINYLTQKYICVKIEHYIDTTKHVNYIISCLPLSVSFRKSRWLLSFFCETYNAFNLSISNYTTLFCHLKPSCIDSLGPGFSHLLGFLTFQLSKSNAPPPQ